MRRPGQLALVRIPQTNLREGKLRPVLIVRRVPGPFDDWLVCMVSSQLRQQVAGFDELVQQDDADFLASGLKQASVLRIGRLAVVDGRILVGAIGEIGNERLSRVQDRLSQWMRGAAVV